jgi:hypothetical protein
MSVATFSPAPSRKFSKNSFVAFYQSSTGKKIIVGVTGLIFFLGSHLSHGIASVIPIVVFLGFLK